MDNYCTEWTVLHIKTANLQHTHISIKYHHMHATVIPQSMKLAVNIFWKNIISTNINVCLPVKKNENKYECGGMNALDNNTNKLLKKLSFFKTLSLMTSQKSYKSA